jgi:hypothetical protein
VKVLLTRRHGIVAAGLVALLAIALPAIAADPTAEPPGHENKPEKVGKPDKGPELARSLRGTVAQTADDQGRPTFTITVDGVVWELSAGPKWFHGDNNPLAAHVGASVEVSGTYHEGETELDVETVNGNPIRAAGKPPWAGGPRVVGEAHPGWKAWKADGHQGQGHGRAAAPGQLKDKTGSDETDPDD